MSIYQSGWKLSQTERERERESMSQVCIISKFDDCFKKLHDIHLVGGFERGRSSKGFPMWSKRAERLKYWSRQGKT